MIQTMPVIRSAKKKLRQDKKRTRLNQAYRQKLKQTLKAVKKHKTAKTLKQAYQILDRAAKKKVIHQRRADRLKSRLAKRR
jgi:small subunit ribosomal protein S20